jgi:hypothetical protein
LEIRTKLLASFLGAVGWYSIEKVKKVDEQKSTLLKDINTMFDIHKAVLEKEVFPQKITAQFNMIGT